LKGPEKFEDRDKNALVELLNQKRKVDPIGTAAKARDTGNVVNLMDALRKSLSTAGKSASQPAKSGKHKKASGQRDILTAIFGQGEGKSKGANETKVRQVWQGSSCSVITRRVTSNDASLLF
jgi:DNA end-binding protein Ku